jgi:hypothetical protein
MIILSVSSSPKCPQSALCSAVHASCQKEELKTLKYIGQHMNDCPHALRLCKVPFLDDPDGAKWIGAALKTTQLLAPPLSDACTHLCAIGPLRSGSLRWDAPAIVKITAVSCCTTCSSSTCGTQNGTALRPGGRSRCTRSPAHTPRASSTSANMPSTSFS